MPRIMSGMSIRERMANMWGAVKRSANRVSSVATAPFRRPAGRDPLNMSVVFRGVQILQTAVSGLPVRQLRHGMAVEPARIVERPDPDTWRADFISETVMGLALNGNAFWLRLKGVDGSTIGLRNLPPALVSVSDARGDIANPDKRYWYMGREYTSNDIIHLRFLKVPGRLRGMGPIEAAREEIEGAIAEGVELQTLKAPAAIDVDEAGQVKGLYVTPQMVSAIKDGRASIRPTGEEDLYIPCDVLIVAIGQNIETRHFEEAGIPVERGKIRTKSTGTFENMPGVFAGGDCASGPASVITAIAAGKVVAANIDEYLGYHHEISCDVEIPEPNLSDRSPCGRVNLTEREACLRVKDFEGVENCMTENEAKQEAGRCLRCDHFGYGIFKGGRESIW